MGNMDFGHLKSNIRGVITTKISPFEQKAFKGLLSHGLPNAIRRTASNLPFLIPPTIIGYLIYDWAENTHHHSLRKNPADYENEK
ncbi:cytochrome b-c1 complex subunit 8 [Daktulosphaira vitifoliae]|uniref:cytochrome b-c1 complex subunit 8 n=1 Tax=Daktulosphaira vitifoliae TaxID=58002 RepID=UPI0021AA93E9|nr:cytochrome b-c1 complex subunit 8 [Daktulosphaira vitifoliae]XP_050542233.1 cytochrome b-c1 complex subunit 8 [Daktulosphaira vitifoliae]XP_050542234.1 cytochrome b-c1 complex subunit 8 [Daktulosphaira vitifoliae]XP_050542235.1 cytochrome b-c1 complex subunit 8 [Daktulosphaira vitifoliae]